MFKIGHLIEYIGYVRGGAERLVEELCRRSNKTRFEPVIVTTKSILIPPNFKNLNLSNVSIRTFLASYEMRNLSFRLKGNLNRFFYLLSGLIVKHQVRYHINDF